MRRTTTLIGSRLPHPLTPADRAVAPFSTFSGPGGGDGRGRGRGRPTPRFSFVPPPPPGHPPEPEEETPSFSFHPPPPEPLGPLGHGRGRSTPSDAQSMVSSNSFTAAIGAGRGGGVGMGGEGQFPFHPGRAETSPHPPEVNRHARLAGRGGFSFHPGREQRAPPPPPGAGRGEPGSQNQQQLERNRQFRVGGESFGPPVGAGRGGPRSQYQGQQEPEPNRHIRVGSGGIGGGSQNQVQQELGGGESAGWDREGSKGHESKYQPEQAMELEDRGWIAGVPHWKAPPARQAPPEGQRARAVAGGGRGMSGRGMEGGRGRGRGRGREMEGGRGRGRGRGRLGRGEERRRTVDLSVGNDADGESFRNRVGLDVMRQLDEGFEEVVSRTMPSPVDEAYLSAIDLTYRLEFEPEFLMGDLDSNPDIDDKEPIPLRDALEKVKPFLMAYEGIESHEEWEEIVEETMERVPALKKIVDHYSGPDRFTGTKQNEELEKVAKTLPENVPESIKRFTDRAVLSLRSNSGWGFDRKHQFIDKLVSRMSHHYKPTDFSFRPFEFLCSNHGSWKNNLYLSRVRI